MDEIAIDDLKIGSRYHPIVVAELSGNHNHSLERALLLLEKAKESGAHAVKIQTYTPDTLTMDVAREEFLIQEPSSLWYNKTLYQLYSEAYLPWEWHAPLFARARELELLLFSSPFDESAVDFLESLGNPCYKIASPEIVDLPLIRKAAATKKPLIISTGAATLEEIAAAVATAKEGGCHQLLLLKCTAAYPASPSDINLKTIPHLAQCFDLPVGLSDHTLGIGVAIASIALGASLIEKHFTLSRDDGGVDSVFSMEPAELQQLVIESKRAWESIGRVSYGLAPSERVTHSHRPSLYFKKDLPAGTVLEASHICSIRPGRGLAPKECDRLLGLKLNYAVVRGQPLQWDLFKEMDKESIKK